MEPLLVVVFALGALLVRVGQALAAMGLARAKNVASAGFRSLADICVSTLCFWAIGAAILFQERNPVFALRADYLVGWSGLSARWLEMMAILLIATGIIAPALAERSRLIVPLATGALLAGVVFPLVAHWSNYGWLNELGFVDVAGAAPVHLAAAVCAAVAVFFVGPRDGKYNRDGSSNMIPGHSVLMILVSVLLMLVGWLPYVGMMVIGDRAGAAANALIAGAAGGLMSLLTAYLRFGKTDVLLTCGGILGGLVSITAAAAEVHTFGAFLIGLVAGFVIPWLTVIIDLRWKIDDPGGVIAIHGIGGIWALVAAGLFVQSSIADRLKLLGVQVLGIIVVIAVAGTFTAVLMILLRSTVGIRSKEADEYDGLDLAEHDINAHPDFQQTMIKSYHLREA